MKSKIDEILDQLLEEIKDGKSIADCLKKYPGYVDELEPLLRLAGKIEDLPKPEPEPEAVRATVTKVRKMVASEEYSKKRFSFRKIFSFQPVMIRTAAVVLLIILIGGTGMLFSAKSLPGDLLYPVKIFTEKLQYTLTINPAGKAELHLVFADRRTKELFLTYTAGEEIDKELLNAMLNEASSATKFAETLSDERSVKLMVGIRKCNQYQMEVLESIKPHVYSCDTAVINEAINLCTERHQCIQKYLDPESNIRLHNCPCWNKCCNWE